MRVLVTGGKGQLGRALAVALHGDEVLAPGHGELDVTDRSAVAAVTREFLPEVVIHAAAWTDTAGCERDPERAIEVNATGAANVAEACAASGATIVYVSTNEVFDGEASEPYSEDAATCPLNSYGLSKLAGEHAVLALDRSSIVRTSWLYGPGRVSFPEKVMGAAKDDGKLRMVTDEMASPTYTVDLAAAIAELIRCDPRGVFHLTNVGGCSRLEWARTILHAAGLGDTPIEEVTQADFGAPYRKPAYSLMANSRAAALGIVLRPWSEALAEYLGRGQALRARTGAPSEP